MNNFNYEMFLNGTNDGFNDVFLQNNNSSNNLPLFNSDANNNSINNHMNNNMNSNLYTPNEGFLKGNMFRNLYEPFRNYQPAQLNPRSEQERALLNLDQMAFAMHEANLYLDNFPDDMNMINRFNEFREAYDELLNDYQSKYGPIEINNPYMTTSPFAWTNDKWPWDRRSL